MLHLYELSPPALWSSIISSQLSAQNSPSLPRLRSFGTPDSWALSQDTLSPWQDDLCWQGTILHHACFGIDILSTTQVCHLLLHLCDKNRGEGGKASSRLMVSKVPVYCAGDGKAEQSWWWWECAAPPSQQTRNQRAIGTRSRYNLQRLYSVICFSHLAPNTSTRFCGLLK